MPFRALLRTLAWSYAVRERGRTLLTVLGLALGVAVLVAIDLANESSLRSFRQSLDDVAGRATLTIVGNGTGVDPRLVGRLAGMTGVVASSPLIQGRLALPPGDDGGTTESLTLLGIDFLFAGESLDNVVRDVDFRVGEGTGIGDLVTDPSAVLLAEGFAASRGLEIGARFDALAGGFPREMRVAGLVDGGGLETALGGRIAIADIGIADLLLRRGGLVDRIDIVTTGGTDLDRLRAEINAILPPGTMVERPARRGERVEEMLAAFRFNLRALGHISLLVGAFLIYNTMSIAVVRRRTAIGALRAMGVTRRAVRAAILAEGLAVGFAGGLIGVAGGVLLAWGLVDAVSGAISINFARIEGARLFPDPAIILTSWGLGVGFALAAAWGPARDAAATAPANTMRRGTEEALSGAWKLRTAFGVALAVAGTLVLTLEKRSGPPWVGYTATLCYMGAFVCWIRPFMTVLVDALKRPFARVFGAEGLLASASTRAALSRASVAIGGLMISVGMAVSITVMVASFRDTVIDWMDQVLLADIYLVALGEDGPGTVPSLPPGYAAALGSLAGVAQVDGTRVLRVLHEGRETQVAGRDFDGGRFPDAMLDGRDGNTVVREAKPRDAVVVSQSFAHKFSVAPGGKLTLDTPSGPREFPVAGVYQDFSSEQGTVVMDMDLFRRLYRDRGYTSLALYLDPGASAATLRDRAVTIANRDGDTPAVTATINSDLREQALVAFDRTFGVTEALKLIAIIVAVLGVATTLMAQLLDRRDEIVTLRVVGASKRTVARIILLESATIGIGGIILGVAVGLMLSWILTRVIMLESFGWTIEFSTPPWPIVQTAAIVLAATVLSALIPARQAVALATGGGKSGVR